MLEQISRCVRAVSLLCVLVAVHAEAARTSTAQSVVEERRDTRVFALPTRRVPDAPPAAPPALPAGADRVTPLTIDTVVRRQPASGSTTTLRQTISRTADRIHIAAGNGREWLLERNVRDPRRVLGFLIDHTSRSIVLYEESDLRMMMGIRGWADVLTLGFDVDALSGYKSQGQARTIGGIRFARYERERPDALARYVWWSEEQLLPSRFTTADSGGVTGFSIRRVRRGADPALFRPPTLRLPTYRVFDLANWMERR